MRRPTRGPRPPPAPPFPPFPISPSLPHARAPPPPPPSSPPPNLRGAAGKGGKNRRRGKADGDSKRELTFKEDGQGAPDPPPVGRHLSSTSPLCPSPPHPPPPPPPPLPPPPPPPPRPGGHDALANTREHSEYSTCKTGGGRSIRSAQRMGLEFLHSWPRGPGHSGRRA